MKNIMGMIVWCLDVACEELNFFRLGLNHWLSTLK